MATFFRRKISALSSPLVRLTEGYHSTEKFSNVTVLTVLVQARDRWDFLSAMGRNVVRER